MTTTPFFPGFRVERLALPDATLHAEVGGSGPPLLLLHGYPQTHVAWHRVAGELARHFTVVAPDLRGYGDSTGPAGTGGGRYTKRTLALDNLALMRHLGFERFGVMAHDRGGRVGYRLAFDHPEAVNSLVSLTVIPTEEMWRLADMNFGMKNFHWFLLAQPDDLPERMLAVDPGHFLRRTLAHMAERDDTITPEAMSEYLRAFDKASVRHAMCEDYRAAAGDDLAHDRADLAAGRRLACPVHVLWSESRKAQPTPLEVWRKWAVEASGATLPCGHLMAEEAPDGVLREALPFLLRHAGR